MYEIRQAKKDDITRLREIWKLCFGDSENFLDFYYAQRFKEDQTVVLGENGEIEAMLTMLPVSLITPDNRCYKAAMFYAIATHPLKQGQGWGSRLIDCSNRLLQNSNVGLSLLVPAKQQLFDYYRRLDYQEGFFIREATLTCDSIKAWPTSKTGPCRVEPAAPAAYNALREQILSGSWHLAYEDKEIDYQKKLSQLSQADIYLLTIGELGGCAAIERVDKNRVIIKELLIPDNYLTSALQKISQVFPATAYTLRLSAYSGSLLGGVLRPLGMIRSTQKNCLEPAAIQSAYLGLAFD